MGIANASGLRRPLGRWGRYLLLLLPLALLGCLQGAFYQPDRVLYDTPASVGLKYQSVTFPSRDGTKLSGWFIPASAYQNPRNAKATLIHFHGNAQNMSAHWHFVSWLPRRGYNVFVFDYRGYGASQGSPDAQGLFDDANAAIDYVRSRADVDGERLVVFGQSLGGTNAIAAIGAGNRAGVRAVAVEATFHSYSAMASDRVAGAGLFMDDTYSAENYVARLSPIPLLLMHGTSDEVISYSHLAMLYDKAQEPKRMISVEGGGHIEALTGKFGDRYQEALVDFLDASVATM